MDTDLEEVQKAIRILKKRIRKVEGQIDAVDGQLTMAATEADIAYWRKQKKHLQSEKEILLRQEERQVESLLALKASILRKEEYLREEKLLSLKPSTSELCIGSSKLVGHMEEGMNACKDSYCSMRVDTAMKLCELVNQLGAILIRGPPGSGKTSLLQLVALLPQTTKFFENVYYISLANLPGSGKTFESLWAQWHPNVNLDGIRSLPKCTGTPSSERRPNLILVDEGQEAFHMDLTLWGTLKSVMGGLKSHLRMIVVSAWGSASAVAVDGRNLVHTPAYFSTISTVSLWPTNDISVSLQLTLSEATELWDSWCQKVLGVGDKLALFDDLREYLFTLTGRQPGLIVHVLDWLNTQGLQSVPADSTKEKARSLLLSSSFYDSLSSLRSLYRLNKAIWDEEPDRECMRSLLRLLVREEYVLLSSLNGSVLDAANLAVKWGQVIEDQNLLSFPSQIHREFLLRELYCNGGSTIASIEEEGILAFVRRVIERLDPCRLKFYESRNATDGKVYERQYQNEFYRAVCTIIPRNVVLSLDVGPLYGAKGYLDFLLSPLRWGFELLRDGSKPEEHIGRFNTGGTYGKLLQDKVVEQYVILDFRMKPLFQDVQANRIWHVVFNNDFKTATLHIFGSEPETIHVGGARVASILQHTD